MSIAESAMKAEGLDHLDGKQERTRRRADTPAPESGETSSHASPHAPSPDGFRVRVDRHNYRKHSDKNKRLINRSLKENGAGRSIVVDNTGESIGGSGVLEQAEALGLKKRIVETDGSELVVVVRKDIAPDDPRRKQLDLADNATTDQSEWDFDALKDDWTSEELEGWGLEGVNFSSELSEGETDPDEIPDAPDEIVSVMGEIYQLGDHRLMCGDSTSSEDMTALMGGAKADMVFTDPPYGVSIGDKNAQLNKIHRSGRCTKNIINDTLSPDKLYPILVSAMRNVRENCADDASYYVSSPQGGELGLMMMMMKDAGLAVRHMLIWAKNSATFSMGRLDYDYQHEPIFYTWTKSHHCYRGGVCRTTILNFDKPRKCDIHPTMKPVDLIVNLILDATRVGDVVMDAFGGSGSTLIACEQTGRKCRMIELDEKYCDVIRRRWAEFKYGEGCDWKTLTPAITDEKEENANA